MISQFLDYPPLGETVVVSRDSVIYLDDSCRQELAEHLSSLLCQKMFAIPPDPELCCEIDLLKILLTVGMCELELDGQVEGGRILVEKLWQGMTWFYTSLTSSQYLAACRRVAELNSHTQAA